MWSVRPPTLEEATAVFDSDRIQSTTELSRVFNDLKSSGSQYRLHTLPMTREYPAVPSSIQNHLQGNDSIHDTSLLLEALHIARLTKSRYEVELMREANRISSGAHEVVMRELGKYAKKRMGGQGKGKERTGKEGLADWEVEGEGDAEAVFVAALRRQG